MDKTFDRSLAFAVCVLTALLVLNAALCYFNTHELNDRASWVAHTLEVEQALTELRATVNQAENQVLAYVLVGDRAPLLGERLGAEPAVRDLLRLIATLTEDNASQQARIGQLRQVAQTRLDELTALARLRAAGPVEPAQQALHLLQGERTHATLLALIGAMMHAERDLLEQRQRQTENAYATAVVTGLLAALLGLAAVGAVVWLGRRFLDSRRRADERVREEREWLRISLTSIGDAVIATDTDGRVTFLNPAAQALTGWDDAAARGQPLVQVFSIIHEQTRRPAENPVARVLREGIVVGLADHTILVSRDGTERPIEDSAAPIRAVDGSCLGVILVFHDVTERRQQAQALAAQTAELTVAKAHLEAVFHSVSEGIAVFDPQANLIFCNEAQARTLGFANPSDMIRNLAYFAQVFELRDAAGQLVPLELWPASRVVHGERFADWECQARRTDTGQAWQLSFSGSPVRDAAGQQVLSVLVLRDVTERKRAEAVLRASEKQFRTLANSIPQLAWTARPDGYLYWYNQRWYDYTGTTPEQMAGWGWQAVHDPDQLPRVLERWQASLATGEPFDMVFPLRGKDGQFRPFLTRVLPLRDEDGRIVQWFGTNTDISEIKAMEAALKEANRHKDEYLAMLAHELRNPLAPVRNALQILQSPRADKAAGDQAYAMMERQILHMARIVDDLLEVSGIARDKIELHRERLDLARLVRTTVDDYRAVLDAAHLRTDTAVPEVPLWVHGDATRLTQVLSNLLQNAVKFTPAGGTVAVQLQADPQHNEAVLTVRDTGVGIAANVLPRLFEPFTQADRTLDRSQGGLGLGLALVKGLVELHGGTVQAISAGPGQGAEFIVRLPTQPEPAALTGMPPQPEAPAKKLRILVVEDSRDAADSLRLLLELYGYDVSVAYTGPTGVALARQWHPDVVLCDIGLPGLDGYGVVRQLRQHPATAGLRVIAVTGYGGDEAQRRSQEAGFDAHLTKPADPGALQELLAAS